MNAGFATGGPIFVLEQSLGHITHGEQIERAIRERPELRARVLRIEREADGPRFRAPGLRTWSFEASWKARSSLRNLLAATRPSSVFVHTQVAALLLRTVMRDIPTVVSMDATPLNYDALGGTYGHRRQGRLAEGAKKAVNQHALRGAAAVVTWSGWAARSVVDDYGVAPENVHVIPPGVDLDRFRPARQEGRRGETVRILFVGGDFRRKGGQVLLDAVRRLGPGVELDVVTSDPSAVPRSPVAVRVHTGMSHDADALTDLYRRADIFALPTTGECYGIVFGEAAACGLPVVACDVGAVSETVVDGVSGILVPPNDVGGLESALRTLVLDGRLRRQMGDAGRRIAIERLDVARSCGTIFALLQRVGGQLGTTSAGRSDPTDERAAL